MPMIDWIYKGLRWVLGAVFIYAGSLKLMAPGPFAVLIEAYGILPGSLLMPTAIGLPVLEVAAGLGLLLDLRGSLSTIAVLLGLFIAIVSYGIWMGLDTDCGCFGPLDPESEAFHGLRATLVRDLVMLGGVIFLFFWRRCRDIEPVGILFLKNTVRRKRRKQNAYI